MARSPTKRERALLGFAALMVVVGSVGAVWIHRRGQSAAALLVTGKVVGWEVSLESADYVSVRVRFENGSGRAMTVDKYVLSWAGGQSVVELGYGIHQSKPLLLAPHSQRSASHRNYTPSEKFEKLTNESFTVEVHAD